MVSMSALGTTPESTTKLWLKGFLAVWRFILVTYQIGSDAIKLVQLFSSEFSWPKLCSTAYSFVLNVSNLAEEFHGYWMKSNHRSTTHGVNDITHV